MRARLFLLACLAEAVFYLCLPSILPAFDSSAITLDALTEVQVENLATLGKVWGFLKYVHPAATSGRRDWDRELFGVMPQVLSARDRQSADAVILRWIDDLGPVDECHPCASPPDHPQLSPDVRWLEDQALLGPELSGSLQRIYRNRIPNQQWYVALAPPKNVEFLHEASYPELKTDFALQVLAVYRLWNVIAYWYPYRDLIQADWDDVLRKYIREVGLAKSARDYQRGMLKLAALITDSHEWLLAPLASRPPEGPCMVPVSIRFIEDKPVITDVFADGVDIERGDVIEEIDGASADSLLKEWRPWYGESNDAARLRDIGMSMTFGACGEISLRLLRGDRDRYVKVHRIPIAGVRDRWIHSETDHTLAGPAVRLLEGNIGYIKISGIKLGEISRFLDSAGGTAKGLIVDLRGQPTVPMIGELAPELIDRPVPYARFTIADLSNPGAFVWHPDMARLSPLFSPHYSGKVVILVDELTQSHLEFTAMALSRAPESLIVGSTTAGADGNTSDLLLPGNLRLRITGAGVYYPDGRKTQQVGIIPDVRAAPTIAGITQGRDEVVEVAERLIRQ